MTGTASIAVQTAKAEAFRALHQRPGIFVVPNPWDAGTARLLASLGFEALATTSAGFAFTLGRRDGKGDVSRCELLGNARTIVEATSLPVSADLENCFADAPEAAAETIRLAAEVGLVGGSIEDQSTDRSRPIYDFALAVERVQAAVEMARSLPFHFTLTARAENFLNGRKDLDDTIKRLQSFEAAGADVLYAPGLPDLASIRAVTAAVSRPVNHVMGSWSPGLTLADLETAGVKRVSVGGALARAALGAFLRGANEIKSNGTFTYVNEAASFAELQKRFEEGRR
jgi:2-methylisocitrate lyase-like PEP mutase family enzyme